MMEILTFLLMPLLGAIIGYSTNLLAITMLFRPHREKRVFGVRLPFTPGLIPKERRELARKVGQTLEANILTKESLVEAVSRPEIIQNIVNAAVGLFDDFVKSPKTVAQLISSALSIDEGELKSRIFGKIEASGIADEAAAALARHTAGLLRERALPYLQSEDFVKQAEVFGQNVAPKLAGLCQRLFDEPDIDAALHGLVTKIVRENVRGLTALFVRPERVYANLKESLIEYLEDEGNRQVLTERLAAAAARLDSAKAQAFLTEIFEQNIDLENVFSKLLTLVDFEKLLDLTPGQIIKNPEGIKAGLESAVAPLVTNLAHKAGEYIVNHIQIAKITEERFNAFDVAQVEKILLSVAGKHLRWIAALGGVLGFVIGLLPPLLGAIGL